MSQERNNELVVFDYFGHIAITPKENYDAKIMNVNFINKFPTGTTVEEAIESFTKYGIAERSDFIIKVGK